MMISDNLKIPVLDISFYSFIKFAFDSACSYFTWCFINNLLIPQAHIYRNSESQTNIVVISQAQYKFTSSRYI